MFQLCIFNCIFIWTDEDFVSWNVLSNVMYAILLTNFFNQLNISVCSFIGHYIKIHCFATNNQAYIYLL